MKKLLWAFAFLLCATPASADQFYVVAGFSCDAANSSLSIWFRGAWNEEGEALLRERGLNGVDPFELLEISGGGGGKYKLSEKTVRRTCLINQREYVLLFAPSLPPRFHPEGNCATRRGVGVEVRSGNRVVARGDVDGCTETGDVLTGITVTPGNRPTYTYVRGEEFYK